MKFLIAVLILMGVFWVGKRVYFTYEKAEKESGRVENRQEAEPAAPAPAALPGLPPYLETSLSAAEKRGAAGLRDWLNANRVYVKDPRLAAIELDYVLLISHQDPAEARRIFKDVESRTPTYSPVYDRVKKLKNTFD